MKLTQNKISVKEFSFLLFAIACGLSAIQCTNKANGGKEISENQNQPWYRNSLYGISFETPKKIEEASVKPPPGYEDIMQITKLYRYYDDDFKVTFSYNETKFTIYDKEVGLKGAIGNVVNKMGGTELNLNFQEPENKFDDLICDGTFQFDNEAVYVKGYVYWNSGKIVIITTMGTLVYLKDMEKVLNGFKISVP